MAETTETPTMPTASTWIEHYDPGTRTTYYLNPKTDTAWDTRAYRLVYVATVNGVPSFSDKV